MRTLTLLFSLLAVLAKAQVNKEPEYVNFIKAKKIFDRAVQYSGSGSDTLSIEIAGSGVIHESGHYSLPEERTDMPEKYTLQMFRGVDNFYINGETNYRGRPLTRQVYVKGDSVFYKDYFSRNPAQSSLSERVPILDEILTLHPVIVLKTIERSLPSLRYLGKSGQSDLISFNANQITFTVRILPDGQISQISYLAVNNYYGDNIHRYEYSNYKSIDGYKLPTQFKEYEFGALRKDETFSYNLKPSNVLPVNQVCSDCSLLPKKNKNDDVVVKNIGGSLYAVELNAYNNRSLFLVGNKGVTVFEAPLSYEASQAVIDAVERKTGGKPITQLVVTHHHPDHAGGLRAFVEKGAKIITTKGNIDFFNRLVNFPHLLSGQENNTILKPSYMTVDSVQTFGVNTSEPFTIYFTGDTQHTKEYLLAYFPKEKVLFHGDLSFFKAGSESAATVRDLAIDKVITSNKLDVEKIYGSWPLKGYKDFGTKEEFEQKLKMVAK